MQNDIITLTSISKSFNNVKILDDINLSFKAGGFYSLIGKSGSGKSTLLRCLNGLEIFDSGKMVIDGTVVDKNKYHDIRSKVGMVFQSFQLFPHMTLFDNIKKPQMIVRGSSLDEAEHTTNDLLAKVGLTNHAEKYPYQLSGGQQQRGSIARALALKPKVMLYDEPTSALDPQLVDEVHQVMRNLDNEKMTQIVVTHEMSFARDIADTVIYLDHGKIIEMGDPSEIFSNPKEELTRQFLRKYL